MRRNMHHTVWLAAAACLAAPALSALPGDWQEPIGGYTVVYEATSWATPYFATPFWGADPFRGDYYAVENSFVTTDALTGEDVLYMTPSFTDAWDSYALVDNGGAGTVEDKMTIDFRFRLLDPDYSTDGGETPGRQFNVAVWRPDALGDGSRRFMVNFTTEEVLFLGGASAAYDIGTDWHDVRLTIDPSGPMAYLYLNGSSTPILAHQGVAQPQAERNWTYFGHQGGAVGGEVNLAYFKFTNNEIALDPIKQQVLALVIDPALRLSYETETEHFYQLQGLDSSSEWVAVGGLITGTGELAETPLLSLFETSQYQVIGGLAGWEDPQNGFTVAYQAADGVTPDLSNPAWDAAIFGQKYTEETAKLVTDDITGEIVLYLEDPDGARPQPNYALNHSGGSGEADDLLTLEMRVRFLDPEHMTEHFNFGIWRPSQEEGKVQRYTFFLFLDRVSMLSRGSANYPFGTDWNTIRVTIDAAEQIGNLYVNGSPTPLLGNQAARIENATALSGLGDRNAVYFGHQGAATYGAIHLAYVRFSNDEIAAEGFPMEPVQTVRRTGGMELFFTGSVGQTYQLRHSLDLISWDAVDEPFFRGTAEPLRSLIDVEGANDREFFQYVQVEEPEPN